MRSGTAATPSTSAGRVSAIRCPTTMAEHAGAVIFGGPQSANDPDDFIKAEIDFIGVPLQGEQALSRHLPRRADAGKHLGERVAPHPEGKAEVGYYPVRPTPRAARSATGRPTCTSGTARASICRAASSCWPKATSSRSRRSAPARGFAIQFHAEVTHAMMCRWTTRGHARMELPGAKQRHEHFADRPVYDHGIRAWLSDFLDYWLAVRNRSCTRQRRRSRVTAFPPSEPSARQSCGNSLVHTSVIKACRCRRPARPAPRRSVTPSRRRGIRRADSKRR